MGRSTRSQTTLKRSLDPHLEERSRIDQEILRLEAQLYALRAARNALLPISKIPLDVLVDIFKVAVTEVCVDGVVAMDGIIGIGWVSATWRKVVLNQPLLWTRVSASLSSAWKRIFLERSKPAHICVRFNDIQRYPELLDICKSELSRIRELSLDNGKWPKQELDLSRPAPVLQALELRDFNLGLCCPLFSGRAPGLVKIHLIQCHEFYFDSIQFTQLNELKVVRPLSMSAVSVSDWLTGLPSLPNLERLTIQEALRPDYHSGKPKPLPHIHLSRLKSLTIIQPVESPTAVSALVCQISGHRDLVSFIKTAPLNEELPAVLRLLTYLRVFEHPRSFFLDGSPQHLKLVASINQRKVTTIEFPLQSSRRKELMMMLRQIPLHSLLTSLRLSLPASDNMRIPCELWSDTLSSLPNLRIMELVHSYTTSFMLYMGSSAHTSTSGTPLAFPSLRYLTLIYPTEAVFHMSFNFGWKDAYAFYKTLKARKEAGVGLEELVLIDIVVTRFEDVPLDMWADRVEEKHDGCRETLSGPR